MIGKRTGISLIASQRIGLSQCREILMAIQFPDDLLVAGKLRIEIVELTPVNQRQMLAALWLKVPIDWPAETEISKSQQIKVAFTDPIRLLDDALRAVGPA